MIQNHRFGTGLNKYLPYIPYKDETLTSEKYFRILDIPDRLYVGKTSFRLRANLDTLVQGSTIYIDIIDSAGNTIYHQIVDFVGKDKTRLIVAHIYENTAPGEATIYVAGRAKYVAGRELEYNNNPDSWDYLHYPNLIWMKKVVIIPTDQNDDEVLFIQSPEVSCHERSEYFSSAPVSSRRKVIQATGSESVSLQTTVQPFQYVNTSRYSTAYIEEGKYFDLDPTGSQEFIQSRQIQVPEYFGFNTIRSNEREFTKDMVGGKITIKNPNGLDTEYTASILKVIDRNTIQVDTPFLYDDGDRTQTSFVGATDFTASYISRDVTLTSFETESFVQLDFKQLEPIAGSVEKVKVSYKPFGTFGEFIEAGEFPLREQNFLVDSGSLLPDKVSIIEQPIGDLSGSYFYENYWSLVSNPTLDLYTSINDSITFDRGGSFFFTASSAITASQVDYLTYFKLQDDYKITSCAGTEYKLQLSTRYSPQDTYTNILSDYENQQIDVYISGSNCIADDIHNTKIQRLLSTNQFGTYIGSISNLKGTTQLDSKFYFKVIDDGFITPIFVIRSGNGWEFKEITLSPRNELGYSPNQAKLMVPINSLKTDVELVLKLEYLSATGKKSDISTTLYGLTFRGSGFPIDRIFSGSGMVSGSEQVNTGSFTGSFWGDFFGIPTGSPTIQYYREHVQSTPAMTWSFGHGLSHRHLVITVWNDNHEVMIPAKIKSDSVYYASIYFPYPVSGYATATVGSIMPTGSLVWDNIIDKPTVVSSSQQIATDISGSWTLMSSSVNTTILNLSSSLSSSIAEVSSSLGNISSSIDNTIYNLSSSFSSSVSNLSSSLNSAINSLSSSLGNISSSINTTILTLSSSLSSSINSISSSIASEKLNRIGDNVYTSSIQVNVDSASYSRYLEVNYLYALGTSSAQQTIANAAIVRWEGNPVYDADHPNQWISSSYYKFAQPGTYVIDSIIKIAAPTGSIEFYKVEDQNGAGILTSASLYSGSIASDNWIRLNYKYITTGSNDRIAFQFMASGNTQIAAESDSTHSYFKITRIYRP